MKKLKRKPPPKVVYKFKTHKANTTSGSVSKTKGSKPAMPTKRYDDDDDAKAPVIEPKPEPAPPEPEHEPDTFDPIHAALIAADEAVRKAQGGEEGSGVKALLAIVGAQIGVKI